MILTEQSKWARAFERVGAVWRFDGRGPHAAHRLTDHHSAEYFNSDAVVNDRGLLTRVVNEVFSPRARAFATDGVVVPRTVVTASTTLGRALAGAINVPFFEFDVSTGAFASPPGGLARALVVTDDVHGGGSARATIRGLRGSGLGVIESLLTLADFSKLRDVEGLRIEALARFNFPKWRPADCPLCRDGSEAIDARARWIELTALNDK